MKKQFTKIIGIILTVCLTVSFFALYVGATENNDGNSTEYTDSSTWEYPTQNPTPTWTGEGTEESPYMISTAQQLADLAYLVNNEDISTPESCYAGMYFKLANNIDLNPGFTATSDGFVGDGTPKEWTPIGALNYGERIMAPFCAIFDGNGKTISGLYLCDTTSKGDATGLFRYIDVFDETHESGVKNLNVTNSYINVDSQKSDGDICSLVATIVGINCSTVENCHVSDAYVKVNDCKNLAPFLGVGGVVGDNNSPSSVVKKCSFDGEVTYTGEYLNQIGGVIASNSGYVADCVNYGTITSDEDKVGGVVGWNVNPKLEYQELYENAGVVSNCVNYGKVAGQYTVGGVVGHTGHSFGAEYGVGTIIGCKNYGEVICETDDDVGGIVGFSSSTSIESCENYAQVSNLSSPATIESTGALLGRAWKATSLKNCIYAQNAAVNKGLLAVGLKDSDATDYYEENIKSFDPVDIKIDAAVSEAVDELLKLIDAKADAQTLAEAVDKLDKAIAALGSLEDYSKDDTLVGTVNALKASVAEIIALKDELAETKGKLLVAEEKIAALEEANKNTDANIGEKTPVIAIVATVIAGISLFGVAILGIFTFAGKKKETK